MSLPAVFLDKDGTLIRDVPYNVDPEQIQLMPDGAAGLRVLHTAGYRLIVITNQSGVARGYFEEADLPAVHQKLAELLAEVGVPLAGFYYCPHHPDGVVPEYTVDCSCRKPEPGLLLQAAQEHRIDLRRSWFIGDILNDVEAGHRAGCRTILLDNGHETEWVLSELRRPDHITKNINSAAATILLSSGIDGVQPAILR
jgi:D,D-heptose 1,7-bisphosphate phosphatase